MYNEKVKDKAVNNDDQRKILQGIVEVICYGDEIEENKNCLVQIISSWALLVSQATKKLAESGVSKILTIRY